MPRQNTMVELFLDSGAFSAFTQGATIDLDQYIAFIKKHLDVLSVYANLDVIDDAEATWQNQKRMEAAGLDPLPCFHIGEPLDYLKRYVAEYEYIALGGMLAIGTGSAEVSRVLDHLWADHLCDNKGMPKVKVHGFGLTSLKLMCRYPWYSVDSTSWAQAGGFGFVFVPKPWAQALDSPWKVCVSTQSPKKMEAGQHIDSFLPIQRHYVLDYFKTKGYVLGESHFQQVKENHQLAANEQWSGKASNGQREVEVIKQVGLSNDHCLRKQLNIIYFLDLEKAMLTWPWAFKIGGRKVGFTLTANVTRKASA